MDGRYQFMLLRGDWSQEGLEEGGPKAEKEESHLGNQRHTHACICHDHFWGHIDRGSCCPSAPKGAWFVTQRVAFS